MTERFNAGSLVSVRLEESVQVYEWLQARLASHGAGDALFQFVYRSYYRLDNAGLTDVWKQAYFALLERRETDLQAILVELYQYPTLRGVPSVQFSFATKLLHTLDARKPIFDSLVGGLLALKPHGRGMELIASCVEVYAHLEAECARLLGEEHVKEVIRAFKRDNATAISDEKVLDFLLWSAGKTKQG